MFHLDCDILITVSIQLLTYLLTQQEEVSCSVVFVRRDHPPANPASRVQQLYIAMQRCSIHTCDTGDEK